MRNSFEDIFSLKITLLGDTGAGKTSVLIRFIQGVYNSEIASTITVNSLYKQVTVRNQIIKLNFIDVPGNYCRNTNLMLFLRNSDAYVVVIDSELGEEKYCESVNKWVNVAENFLDCEVNGLLLFNKCKLGSGRIEELEKVLDMTSNKHLKNMKRFYVSAKDGEGICEAFQDLIASLMQTKTRIKRNSITLTKEAHLNLSIEKSKKKCC